MQWVAGWLGWFVGHGGGWVCGLRYGGCGLRYGGWLANFGLFFLFFLLLRFVDISGQWSVRVVVGLCGSSGGFGGW